MNLTRQAARICTGGPDEDGCLFFCDGRLVAVFVRLSAQHEDVAGQWYLEQGFGPLDTGDHPMFRDLTAAETWMNGILTLKSPALGIPASPG